MTSLLLPSPTFYKGPILAPRPLSLKWTSLDFLRVMPGNTYGTLSLALHRPRLEEREAGTVTTAKPMANSSIWCAK